MDWRATPLPERFATQPGQCAGPVSKNSVQSLLSKPLGCFQTLLMRSGAFFLSLELHLPSTLFGTVKYSHCWPGSCSQASSLGQQE